MSPLHSRRIGPRQSRKAPDSHAKTAYELFQRREPPKAWSVPIESEPGFSFLF
jgi:hypothetical protein